MTAKPSLGVPSREIAIISRTPKDRHAPYRSANLGIRISVSTSLRFIQPPFRPSETGQGHLLRSRTDCVLPTVSIRSREAAVNLTSHVALEVAHHFAFGQLVPSTPLDVGSGSFVSGQAAQDDHVEGRVGLAGALR